MKFLHSFKKFAILEKRRIDANGDIILNGKPSVEFGKYSQPAQTTFFTYLDKTADDVKQKIVTYINNDEDKSIKFLQYCIELFKSNGAITGTSPANYAYVDGATDISIANDEFKITLDDIEEFFKNENYTPDEKSSSMSRDVSKIIIGNEAIKKYNTLSVDGKIAFDTFVDKTDRSVMRRIEAFVGTDADKSSAVFDYILKEITNKKILSGDSLDKYVFGTGFSKDSIKRNREAKIVNFEESKIAIKQTAKKDTSAQSTNGQTVDTFLNVPLSYSFPNNASTIDTNEIEKYKKTIEDAIKYLDETKNISIDTSCSTLRNTGKANNKTWIDLSTERADSVEKLVNDLLSGKTAVIKKNPNGTNGDGTSGNKSPYEVLIPTKGTRITDNVKADGVKRYYELVGIANKYWESKATDAQLVTVKADLSDFKTKTDEINKLYNKFQYVILSIPVKNYPNSLTPEAISLGVTLNKDKKVGEVTMA